MTRFARAKGSKASNERAPEDATPWEVMKEQLLNSKKEGEEAKKRQEAEQQRIQNYENFLRERKTQKKPATWCDFPQAEKPSNVVQNISKQSGSSKNKNKKKHNNLNSENMISEEHLPNGNEFKNAEVIENNKKNNQKQLHESDPENAKAEPNKKKKRKLVNEQQLDTASEEVTTSKDGAIESAPTPKKKNKKNKKKFPQGSQEELSQVQNPSQPSTSPKKNKNSKPPSNTEDDTTNVENTNQSGDTNLNSSATKEKKNKKRNKNKNTPADQNITDKSNENPEKQLANKQNKEKAKKKKKIVDGMPVRRKEITERSFQLIINGKEIELVRFDGFPIMKKDAERLTELKNSMIKKGIPKSEVQRTMKLERRRAEKALARLKRDVCYNCRKGGHNLSDCPELKTKIPGVDGADGVCFKCGSTEHRQSECKVQRDKEFRFATCFICKESGHIARQCPDNPKGLYPNGGSCKLCGDVTHLRKDCPTQNNKKEESAIKLHTFDTNDGIEDMGLQNTSTTVPQETAKKPKKIKF